MNTPEEGLIPHAVPVAVPVPVHPSALLAAQTIAPSPFRGRLFATVLFVTTATLTGMGIRWVMTQPLRTAPSELAPTPPQPVSKAQP
jgi:hypothetical protein